MQYDLVGPLEPYVFAIQDVRSGEYFWATFGVDDDGTFKMKEKGQLKNPDETLKQLYNGA